MDAADKNIQYLKGVGEKRAALFAKLDVHTVGDLLTFYPRSYENWADTVKIADAPPDKNVCISAVVSCNSSAFRISGGRTVYKAIATDGINIMQLIFFNNKYAGDAMKDGEEFLFYGKVRTDEYGGYQMISPKYAPLSSGECFHPVYPQTENLSSKIISKTVKTALGEIKNHTEETLPAEQLKKFRLPGLYDTLRMIHFPVNEEEIKQARRRLAYEELLILQTALLLRGAKTKDLTPYAITKDYTDSFKKMLGFELTGAQKRAINECVKDMASTTPMRRLLQGDVGSGKTAVAAAVIYNVIKNGGQCALMAPTEVLANQHYKTFCNFFANSGINIALLTGSVTKKNKTEIKERLQNGEYGLVIGTHAVITDDVIFKDLALVITDEQHRFGVEQRRKLSAKGQHPHMLVMSATPIPRTLSLMIYGDLDISVLDEKPTGRQKIKTYSVTTDYTERIYNFVEKEIKSGRQCYIVCPLALESEKDDDGDSGLISAQKLCRELSKGRFAKYKTALLHGKMTPGEKDGVMKAFGDGDTDILICTVVIEVGIDVPNASLIVIQNAERFGLSQLHQLRGRVGRGSFPSYCVFISDAKNSEAKDRLSILCDTNDGFVIAEEDLKLRGPGDFFGNRQSGLPALKAADLMTDARILYTARQQAEKILEIDRELSTEENKFIRKKVNALFSDIS